MLDALDEHDLDAENRSPRRLLRLRAQARRAASTTPRARRRSSPSCTSKFFATAFPQDGRRARHRLHAGRDRRLHPPLRRRGCCARVRPRPHRRGRARPRPVHRHRHLHRPAAAVRAHQPDDLPRKYANELHANEILLLAYYIAAVNIETSLPRPHADATDAAATTCRSRASCSPTPSRSPRTTTSIDADDVPREQRARRDRRSTADPRRSSATRPTRPGRQRQRRQPEPEVPHARRRDPPTTYAARSTATHKNTLYDSYIRAIRWAIRPDRDQASSPSSPTAVSSTPTPPTGIAQALAEEFTRIYVYNLRGNQRTAGERPARRAARSSARKPAAPSQSLLLVKGPPLRKGNRRACTTAISATTSAAKRSSPSSLAGAWTGLTSR